MKTVGEEQFEEMLAGLHKPLTVDERRDLTSYIAQSSLTVYFYITQIQGGSLKQFEKDGILEHSRGFAERIHKIGKVMLAEAWSDDPERCPKIWTGWLPAGDHNL